jgi:hypothetical protein
VLQHPDIADVQRMPGTIRIGRSRSTHGHQRVGIPLVRSRCKVDDGTGRSPSSRAAATAPVKEPRQGEGVVRDVAVFNGMPLGLHLEERDLDIRRN